MKTTRLLGSVIGVLVLTAACGSQPEPEKKPADQRSNPREQWVSLNDALIIPGSCSTMGGDAHLTFTVGNSRIEDSDELTAITSPVVASIDLEPSGPIELAPFGKTTVGLPGDEPRPFVTAPVRGLQASGQPGSFVPVTFHFDQAGPIDKRVPVEPCQAA